MGLIFLYNVRAVCEADLLVIIIGHLLIHVLVQSDFKGNPGLQMMISLQNNDKPLL